MPVSTMSRAARFGAVAAIALALGACAKNSKDVTGSIARMSGNTDTSSPQVREARWRELSDGYAKAYASNPNDAATAYNYGLALRALGQRAQALAVLEKAALKHPEQKQIVGAYGRALSDVGRYEQALSVLDKAHTPDRPDWRILNAQGACLDQLGRSSDARGYYEAALKIAPGDPAILSNLGLSYALNGDLAKADATLRQAAASPNADDKVRANLAMVQQLKAGNPAKAAKPAKAAAFPAAPAG